MYFALMKLREMLIGKLALLAMFTAFLSTGLFGQGEKINDPTTFTSEIQSSELIGTVNLRETKDPWDPYLKTTRKAPAPGSDQNELDKIVQEAEMKRLREEWEANGGASQKTTAGPAPVQGTNFTGNSYNSFAPTDNSIAIGMDGRMISGTNARLHTYDENGTALGSATLNGFFSAAPANQFKFDPKVIYDIDADRFIVVCLAAFDSTRSRVMVGFSQTSDPSGNYNVYALDGNPFSNGLWTDYPQIGLNQNELFISGNLFTDANQPSFTQNVIWQIEKADGYSGLALDFVTHTNSFFSVHPVTGTSALYGPHMYFVAAVSGDPNSVTLHTIDNSIAGGGTLVSPNSFTISPAIASSANATQPSPGQNFTAAGTRVRDAFFENNRIEFVMNTNVSGRPSVYHGTGFISPLGPGFSNFSGEYITYPDIEIAYPSIAYGGAQESSGVNHCFVAFNYCSSTIFPSNGACYIDGNGISDYVTCRAGQNYIIPISSGQAIRWGDYTSIVNRPGTPGEAWMAASYGNTLRREVTHISELTPPIPVASAEPEPLKAELEVYPNPVAERVMFTFPVEEYGQYDLVIRDIEGREIKRWTEYTLRIGDATVHFKTEALSNGVYFVAVESKGSPIFNEKFVVNK